MILRILVSLLCLVSPAFSALPPVTFNTVSSSDGLPQNTARTLLQDRNGFVWIGTEDGLVQFDGYTMHSYRKQHDNPATLSDNYISALAESQDGRIWAGTMGGGLNAITPETGSVVRFKELGSADIRFILPDPTRNELWLGTDSGLYLLNLSDPKSLSDSRVLGTLVKVPLLLPDGSVLNNPVSGIVRQGDIVWISTRGKGIAQYNLSDKSATWYMPGDFGLEDDTFNMMTADQNGGLWAGGQNHGLVQVLRQENNISFKHHNTKNSNMASNDVMAIADADDGKIWVGTWNGGLALFDPITGEVELYRQNANDPYSLGSDIVMEILRTRDGKVWVGTFDHGVNWFDPAPPFRAHRAKPDEPGGLPANLIWSFASEDKNRLWVGTNKGLARLNLDSHEYELQENIEPVSLWDEVRKDDIRALFADGDYLWIAARYSGLVRLELSTGKLVPVTDLLARDNSLTHSYIRLILKDSQGYIWFGATKGLNRFDPSSGEIRNYMPEKETALSLPHTRIRALFEDSKGEIWVGTSLGLLLIDKQGNPVRKWQYNSDKSAAEQVLTGQGVRGLGEDQQGRIWIATEGGLSVYDRTTEEVIILREENGLPSNATYCALPVGKHMWVSTLRGLARINSETLQVENYYSSDGLPDNEFNFNAWLKLADGRLAFGTLSGFTMFSPERAPGPEQPRQAPPLRLQTYVYKEKDKQNPVQIRDEVVKLDWQNNHISFEYSALHFGTRDAVSYDAFLQGVDKDWSSVGSLRSASYSGLAPGHYMFQIRATDRHGQWQVETEPTFFVVAAPPWKTAQAYAFYIFLAIISVFMGVRLYSRRLRNRAETLQLLVAERTAELEESSLHLAAKNNQLDLLMATRERLFRAVSHEIRTPLTVIVSVLDSMQHDDGGAFAKLPMARKSARRLGTLLDNILDISRREEKKQQSEGTFLIQPALEEALSPYILQAETEDKNIRIEELTEDAWLGLPREAFLMLVSNLLSNACKYTEIGDTILVQATADDGNFSLSVKDSGCGVSAGKEERIFDWFERGNNTATDGWGIGLAFVREASEAAGGVIELQKLDGSSGAHFILTLPLGEKGLSKTVLVKSGNLHESLQGPLQNQEKAYTILLVEDDTDLLQLLPTLFPSHWNCLTSTTAEEGWDLVLDKLPDLVLTDLMLPGESGFDLTKKLKEDSRTSHIPVVILTALGGEEHRLTGLGLSADSFMEKPFDNHELLLRIQGLIQNRERVLDRVKRMVIGMEDGGQEEHAQLPSTEDDFLQKLHGIFATDQDLSAASLGDVAVKLAMSKRSVQREMQRLGISWREYKRLRKLRIAMDLLRNPNNRVSMVADQAGYRSAAHFSKIFKQHSGVSPTEWRREQELL